MRRGYNWLMDVVERKLNGRGAWIKGLEVVVRRVPHDKVRVYIIYESARGEFSSEEPFYLEPKEFNEFKRRMMKLGFRITNVEVGKLVVVFRMVRGD